jgi:ATP-dependent Clp protease adaptor protein ClpS
MRLEWGRMSERTRNPGEIEVLDPKTKTRRKVQKPPLYKVLLHNDDYTTMEFVVEVLKTVFRHGEHEATRIMLHVHHSGVGVAGTYPREIAESKAEKAMSLARAAEYPLLVTFEPE